MVSAASDGRHTSLDLGLLPWAERRVRDVDELAIVVFVGVERRGRGEVIGRMLAPLSIRQSHACASKPLLLRLLRESFKRYWAV